MRLISHLHDGVARPAVVIDDPDGIDRVLDLADTDGAGLVGILSDDGSLVAARAAIAGLKSAPDSLRRLPLLADLELLPPVVPGKIICLGYNYRGHVPVGGDLTADDPEFPDVFVKTPNVLAGANDPVVIPAASLDVDYEGEVAIVIGRRARSVTVEDALDHVAGYTLFNDVSDRAWQARQSQWELGKCFDGFGPLGPALVTPDEIADPHDLLVEVEREGVITVSQSTSTMIFPMAWLVHYLSTVMTLEPGDVISTGTPQKLPEALAAHTPLVSGDSVTIRVLGLGELTTTFIDPPTAGEHAAAHTRPGGQR